VNKKLNKLDLKIFYCIVLLFLLTASSCEEEVCMTCYRGGAGGIVQGR
jgi:hypothetical protein